MFDKLITSVSGRIVEYAFTDNTSDNDEREICSYGIEILISSIIGVLIILLIGSFIGMLYETVLYLTVFISLRHYTGGLHLNTYTKCNISSSLLFVMIMSLYKFIGNNYKIYPLLVCVFLSVAVVIIHCPVENVNKPVSEEERKKLKIKAVILSIDYGIIIKEIALKNNGMCDLYEEDNQFCCNVIMKRVS